MEDTEIIHLFLERSEDAIRSLDEKYGRLCNQISYNILHNSEDAKECVNDTYLGVWNTIPPKEPNPLRSYVCRITKNISLKMYRDKHAQKRNSEYDVSLEELNDCITESKLVDVQFETKQIKLYIEEFLQNIDKEKRVMFVRRYWFHDSVKDIANSIGISERNASMKLMRIRKSLKNFLEQRGVNI